MPTRIIITGSRSWYCPGLAEIIVNRLIARHGPDLVIVHGEAPGVDQSFAEAAEELGVDVEPHPARWDDLYAPGAIVRRDARGMPYNASAGPRRNSIMVAAGAGLCLALHRDIASSKGTKDCARQAIGARIPTWLVDSDEANPTRLLADDPRLS